LGGKPSEPESNVTLNRGVLRTLKKVEKVGLVTQNAYRSQALGRVRDSAPPRPVSSKVSKRRDKEEKKDRPENRDRDDETERAERSITLRGRGITPR